MKPPPASHPETGGIAGRLDELRRVVRAGKLITLLKGEGLDRNTVEELMQPESLSALKGILTDHIFDTEER